MIATSYLLLITQIAQNADLIHLERTNHFFTLATMAFKFSGSDFIIRSNSTNFPGRKNTFVMPNLKSLLFSFSECSIAYNQNTTS